MRIHHLNCATFCPHSRLLFNGRGSPFESAELICHCQLIETNDGLILIDTGLGSLDIKHPEETLPGRAWRALNRPRLDFTESALYHVRRLGFAARDVQHIVLTHLDFDHAGGLPDFPHAKVHVHKIEHAEATKRPTPRDRMRYAPKQMAKTVDWELYETDGERWFGFESVRALKATGAEILLVPLFGHTRGHCGVAVKTSTGWELNAGDAFFYHGEIEAAARECPPGLRAYQNVFQFNRRQRMKNQDRLRALYKNYNHEIKIFCSHDPDMLGRFPDLPASPPKRVAESVELSP